MADCYKCEHKGMFNSSCNHPATAGKWIEGECPFFEGLGMNAHVEDFVAERRQSQKLQADLNAATDAAEAEDRGLGIT